MKTVIDFAALKIQLASPARMLEWSHGEVSKPETINYRTLKAEKGGLFAEEIFGPTKDWECYCGKYKRIRYKGIICDKCGVEVTLSRVRRERMGHINLATPVAHIWFFKGTPSKLSLLLDISPRNLSSIIYFNQYIVLDVDKDKRSAILEQLEKDMMGSIDGLKEKAKGKAESIKSELEMGLRELEDKFKGKEKEKETRELKKEASQLKAKSQLASIQEDMEGEASKTQEIYQTVKEMVKRIKRHAILSEDEYLKLMEYNATDHLRVGMGAEAILEVIKAVDLAKLAEELHEEVKTAVGQRRVKATRRLRVVEGFRKANISPEWMLFLVLPVIPPDLRPMVQLSGGRFATSDLNDLYRRVINRNNRLKHLIDLGAPEIILRNEKRMLQEAVDALIDSSNARTSQVRAARKPLRSLSEMLRGKQGRFRQNLLGKRVDYSGRSVIVVGPELNLDQCGLPKEMALEMFKPYVLSELIKQGVAPNLKSAKHALERRSPEVYDTLEKIIENHPVLLNRAPTLHKLGIQAFYPQLIEGNAIRLHPCVCAGYNADFDGDQMAVHVPLTLQAQEEARTLMMPSRNLLKPADGAPITVPNKEMAMGCYYMTTIDESIPEATTIFSDEEEVELAYLLRKITLRQKIKVRLTINDQKTSIVETTIGRLRFNAILPANLRFINSSINAAAIKALVKKAINICSADETSAIIDNIKNLGFKSATTSGLSVAVTDCKMITEKGEIIEAANKKAETVQDNYLQGLITEEEKRRLTFEIWMETTDTIADKTWNNFSENNAVKVMINSGGTRASKDQVKQLAAMRGLVVDPLGKIVELPTKSNFREGLSIFEYVTSARGSRKGLTDSALKTADAGYLTRRLVDVAHDVIIRAEDCATQEGLEIIREGSREKVFESRIIGRTALKDIKSEKKLLVKAGDLIDEERTHQILESSIHSIWVRSPLSCELSAGMCAKCYGWDFSNKKIVEVGTPVGVIAAQSIGEPGTQLTMRVKHSGGIVGLDVTQGLPRVEELFEARVPKNFSPIAEINGKVSIQETDAGHAVTIKTTSKPEEVREYIIPKTSLLQVAEGDLVHAGTQLAAGSLDVKEILQIRGMRESQLYLLEEIQRVYESQGIPINDVHFEVIIRKMSDKVRVETAGDTIFLPGEIATRSRFIGENKRVLAEGGEPATATVMILGITRSSLFTESWLSAASFMETTRVLGEAAAEGAEDPLLGLKENVIIGRLIPTSPERAMIH